MTFDERLRDALEQAILDAIMDASSIDDIGLPVIRSGETYDALTSVLGVMLALSVEASGSPTRIRRTVDDFSKRLHREITGNKIVRRPDRCVNLANLHGIQTASTRQ